MWEFSASHTSFQGHQLWLAGADIKRATLYQVAIDKLRMSHNKKCTEGFFVLLDVLTELTLDANRKGESSFSFIEQLKNKKILERMLVHRPN